MTCGAPPKNNVFDAKRHASDSFFETLISSSVVKWWVHVMTLLGDGCYMFLEEGICNPIDFVKMAMLQMILRKLQSITFKKLKFVFKAKNTTKQRA